MKIVRFAAAAFAALTLAVFSANGENKSAEIDSANAKIQYLYMVGAIKSNVDKDPGSEFSAYAKEILSSNHGYNEVSRVYSDLNVAADAPPAAPALREHDTALKMCPRIPDSVERSVDGTVWYVAHNYYISFDSSGAALYMRSPSGMIKETAPKELRDYFSERDEILTEDLPAGNLVRLRAKLSGVTREALCEIDRGLSSVLLYDFSASQNRSGT